MSGFRLEGLGPRVSDRERRWQSYLAGIAVGNTESLALLYDESASSLMGLALRVMNNNADAEEIILEVYEQVWRTAQSFDPERGSAWRWLSVLVHSRAVDRLRTAASRYQRDKVVPITGHWDLASSEPLPDRASILSEERGIIRQALQLLPGEQRQALEMAYFAGLTHVEISAVLGVPLGTIKTRIRAALEKLRTSLFQGGLTE